MPQDRPERRGKVYYTSGSTLALGTRGYQLQWEFDPNAADLELTGMDYEQDPANGYNYRARIRHPVRHGLPALIFELQGTDGQTGFRIGGPSGRACEELLGRFLSGCWSWDSVSNKLVAFEQWAAAGKSSWSFIADVLTKTTPPTTQPVICLHNPKPEASANDGASLASTWQQVLPIPAAPNDSFVRASRDLALILELPLVSEMVSIWNAGFSRPRILTFQPAKVIQSIQTLCHELHLPMVRVQAENELPM